MGHEIETKEGENGRKDVTIKVNMLDVNEKDPATQAAKATIEREVLPKLANADVLVIVIHKRTNEHTQQVVKLPHVRAYAEAAIKGHMNGEDDDFDYLKGEYIVVEHHITNNTVNVTTL